MKERLYYKDAYMKEFDSEVLSCEPAKDGWDVVLINTAFYPEGGGQGADRGVLTFAGASVNVLDVHEKNGTVIHKTDAPAAAGTKVHGIIDWEVRFDHMQQHSGEHIASGMICKKWNCDNVGFHMGSNTVTIDYNAPISFEEILELEKDINKYIWEAHDIDISFPEPDELAKIDYRSKKELAGEVRIVSFPGADTCACCGTHVRNSSEVGLVKFLSAVKFHEGTRFEMLCGKRAFEYLALCYKESRETGIMLNSKPEEISGIVGKMKEEIGSLKVSYSKTEDEYFRLFADTLKGKGNVLIIKDELSSVSVRKLCVMAASASGGIAVVIAGESRNYKYAVSQEGTDLKEFTKKMNEALNGRGGGKGGFAQGSLTAGEKEVKSFFADGFTVIR